MSCSDDSLRADEQLPGTATTASFILAVEQPGAFAGREAALSSGLPVELGSALLETVGKLDGKLLLVRTPGRHPDLASAGRRVWWCWTRYPRPTVWTAQMDDVGRLPALCDGPPEVPPVSTAVRVQQPVLMVCTHGRRDACCATSGRKLLSSLTGDTDVWESSHQGGHRLAPVVLDLNTGYQHGRVTSEHLSAIAQASARGEVHLATARGHVGLAPELQAVDLAVRDHLGHPDLEGVTLHAAPDATVTAVCADKRLKATVQRERIPSRPESCGGKLANAENLRVHLTPAP